MQTFKDKIEDYIRKEIAPLPNVDLEVSFPDDDRIVIKLIGKGKGRAIEVNMTEMLTEFELFNHLSVACKKLRKEHIPEVMQLPRMNTPLRAIAS